LLDLMDATAEVRDGTVRTHGGNWTSFRDLLAAEQQVALRMVRVAETDLKREQRQLAQARIGLDRRQRYGRKTEDNKRYPNIVVQKRKRSAQESAGRHRILQLDKVSDARSALDSATDEVRDDARIRIELPGTVLPAGRTVLEMRWRGAGLIVRGPERIALIGPNGAGKTSLLTQIAERATTPSDLIRHRSGQIGYLPQRLDLLDDQRSVLDNVRGRQPHASPNTVRASLARFLLRGDRVDQPARTLSGGERFRASLAMLLLADPPPELLLLDEPTNSLDLESAEQLATALAGYHGALIVASHDLAFIESIGVQRFWALDATGVLNDSVASP
jgi:ATPase subunit of ABC transporter with duplicated ATPase domains